MILWDWNGTLLDDAQYCVNVMNPLLLEYHLPPFNSIEEYRKVFSFPVVDYYRRLGFPEKDVEICGRIWMDRYIANEKTIPLRDGAFQTLQNMRGMGEKQMLLSASKVDLLEEQTRERGIRGLLDGILGLDNIWAASKVAIALNYLHSSNTPPEECCMIGDTLHDAEVAQAIGCPCVLLTGGHQTKEKLQGVGMPVCSDPAGAAKLALNLIRK